MTDIFNLSGKIPVLKWFLVKKSLNTFFCQHLCRWFYFLLKRFHQLKNLSIVSTSLIISQIQKLTLKNVKKLAIGSLKGVTEAVCGLKSADLSNDTIKTSTIHFSHNKKVQIANQFYHCNNNSNKKYSKFIVCGTHIHLPFRGELWYWKL